MNEEIAVSSHGQIAQWTLALSPLQHLTQAQLDQLIQNIDSFVFDQINAVTKGK